VRIFVDVRRPLLSVFLLFVGLLFVFGSFLLLGVLCIVSVVI
jgi:hypothetical protein